MRRIFSPDSPYKRRARFLAALWTLLVFIGCLTPSRKIPKVNVPLIDKWTHVVMFLLFTFLWMCAGPIATYRRLFTVFLVSVLLGVFIEVMQGVFTSLGRSMEGLDIVADSIGGALGVLIFFIFAKIFHTEDL